MSGVLKISLARLIRVYVVGWVTTVASVALSSILLRIISTWLLCVADPNGKTSAGESYVVFGRGGVGSTGTLDLSALDGGDGLVINGTWAQGSFSHRINRRSTHWRSIRAGLQLTASSQAWPLQGSIPEAALLLSQLSLYGCTLIIVKQQVLSIKNY